MLHINPKRNLFGLICYTLLFLIIILGFSLKSHLKTISLENPLKIIEEKGCDIPRFQETQIKKYIVPTKLLKCEGESYWICLEPGRVRVCPEADQKHQGIRCTYTFIIRIDDDRNKNGSSINAGTEYVELQSDFFHVNCTANDGKKWNNIMAGVQKQSSPPTEEPSTGLGLNVLIFGIDSLSRLQFIRGLPKTYNYLTTSKNVVILTGYNKVGEGTAMAEIPILTGNMEDELPATQKKLGKKASFVNVYPFIWNDFKVNNVDCDQFLRDLMAIVAVPGYVTAYGEDAPASNTFNYRLKGFREQPTDHFLRPYYISAQKYFRKDKSFCLRGLLRHKIMMKWAEEFFSAYPNRLKFSFLFYSEYTHGYDNLIGNADTDLMKFLTRFNNTHLNNTLLILLSDHGYRFSKVTDKLQRRQEERMPFLSLVFPNWFEDKYPEAVANLRTNADRLTTPFDIHSTLRSVLHFEKPTVSGIKSRGISLFNEIPLNRTCRDAGIKFEWCICENWKEIALDNKEVIRAATFLLNEVNKKTASFRHLCENLYLKKISWSIEQWKGTLNNHPLEYGSNYSDKTKDRLYLLEFHATPKGQFEGLVMLNNTIIHNLRDNIIRKDRYKLTSGCLNDTLEHLHKFCICRNI